MCFSLATFNPAQLPVRIEDPKCVAKTFPDYFEAFLGTAVLPAQRIPVICIDGPTASGKGTVAAEVAKRLGYHFLDSLDGDEAGIKSITFQVNGENAYGYLKSEKGVHRLVRISPFNAAGKRQTSFVSCDVMPDIEEDLDIEVKDDDIRIDTYRSSGAGGQHINKTSSAIRITHFPSGIVVQCQNERSQHMNKDKAMQMLKAKLYLLKQEENAAKEAGIRGEVKEIGWGSQIRSYVLQPYTMVKDHRTDVETGNADAVLDGNIDIFINGYLKWLATRSE
jgi:peptide chain release factor 2